MSWDAGAITGSIGLNLSEYAQGMLEAEAIARVFPPLVVEFLENPLLGVVQVAKEAGEAIFDLVSETMNTANSMDLMAQKAGMSIESFSKLSWAAREVNVSAEQLGVGIKMLQMRAAEAVDVGGPTADAFTRFGISTQFLAEHLNDGEGLMAKIMQTMDGLHNAAERNDAAMRLMGRSGADLVPLLAMGSQAIEHIGDTAKSYGAAEDAKSGAAGRAWHQTMVEVQMATEGMKKAFGEAIAPELKQWFEELLLWVQTHMPEIRQHIEAIAQGVDRAAEVIGPPVLWVIEHLDTILELLGAGALGLVVSKSIGLISSLGESFLGLAEKTAVATVAEQSFAMASAAARGGGIGAAVGAASTGDLGGTIGGGLGGLLGGLLGQALIPIPGVGFMIGSAVGGYLGGQAGSAIQQSFHAEVHANFDPEETANQFADKVVPEIRQQYEAQAVQMQSAAHGKRVAHMVGGRGPSHYYAGL